jgi:hypothetical protein
MPHSGVATFMNCINPGAHSYTCGPWRRYAAGKMVHLEQGMKRLLLALLAVAVLLSGCIVVPAGGYYYGRPYYYGPGYYVR